MRKSNSGRAALPTVGAMENQDTPVLQARALSKTYGRAGSAVHALRAVDIDIDIARGEFVVLLGPPAGASRRC